jgi:hypothetical protein
LTWDGQVLWDFELFSPDALPHHDIEVLPSGNVLMIVWENLPGQEAIDAGRDPALVGATFAPDRIVEIEPTGPMSGTIVWEWHAWDHLIQDFDSGAPGFGVVADHPERIDLNYPPENPGASGDWLHTNAIDCNSELDQIAISVLQFDEIWIIDHSTTTQEAAGSSGGNSGKGGDLLYRWGNPRAYDTGTVADQQLFGMHDVTWIEPGLPGAGNLLLFNNGEDRPGGPFSSVDELVPPVDAQGQYTLVPGSAYGPADPLWTYSDPVVFYSSIMSGAQRLASGNTLICEATAGRLFEVTAVGDVVWDYTDPGPGLNWIFKARRYEDCNANLVHDGQDAASGASADWNGNLVPDECESLGVRYCAPAVPNSTGVPAVMTVLGSEVVAADDLFLAATSLPTNANIGYFLMGTGANTFVPPGAIGPICVAPGIKRYLPPVDNTNQLPGGFTRDVGTSGPISGQITAGSTWNFQAWHRDSMAGTSNLTDALSVTFR